MSSPNQTPSLFPPSMFVGHEMGHESWDTNEEDGEPVLGSSFGQVNHGIGKGQRPEESTPQQEAPLRRRACDIPSPLLPSSIRDAFTLSRGLGKGDRARLHELPTDTGPSHAQHPCNGITRLNWRSQGWGRTGKEHESAPAQEGQEPGEEERDGDPRHVCTGGEVGPDAAPLTRREELPFRRWLRERREGRGAGTVLRRLTQAGQPIPWASPLAAVKRRRRAQL